jgi:hypothetical protein
VTLENCQAFTVKCQWLASSYILEKNLPIRNIPDTDASIQTACSNALSVKGNGIDLTEVTLQRPETSSFTNAPDSRCGVVTSGDDQISVDFETANTCLMTHEYVFALALLNIPDAKSGVAGARNGRRGIRHLQATNCRSMATQHMNRLATRVS